MPFSGFTKATPAFLRGLGRNNDKAWFQAHRAEYEAHYLEPALQLVGAIGEKLVRIAPEIHAEPRVNGSLFRVNRDVRFAKDKTPYKDHIDLQFWAGPDRKRAVSAFLLRIRADGLDLAAGALGFDRDVLARYRERVTDPKAGAALERIAGKLARAGFPVQGEHYKKLPRGVESVSESRDRLLRHAALFCTADLKHPREFGSAAFATWCVARWKRFLPLHRWLVDELG